MSNKKPNYFIFNKYYDQINIDFWNQYKHNCLDILTNVKLINGFAYDYGCGTGSGLELLKELGYEKIKGIDLSDKMINIAKQKYDDVDFIVGDMLSVLGWEPGALAICNFDAINYLINDNDWEVFFSVVSSNLKKDGIFLFDTLTENDHQNNWEGSTRVIEDSEFLLINHGDYKNGIAYMNYIWFIKNINGFYEKYTELHKQRTYSKNQIERWLNNNNLKIIKLIDAETKKEPTPETIRLLYQCIKI